MLLLGFFFKSKVNTFGDFILGGKSLPWFVIAMTMLATLANAQQTLGIAGNTYVFGISVMIWFFMVVNIFIYPIIVRLGSRYRALNFATIVDLAEERFKRKSPKDYMCMSVQTQDMLFVQTLHQYIVFIA
jgi:SSS family solute:Na+ symporter